MKHAKLTDKRDHFFFPALAILISATGFAGFSFTYFGPIIEGSYPPAGTVLHLHGWSFFLWYLLFPIQAILIAKRRQILHMTLGKLSVILVLIMTLTGILVLTIRVEESMRQSGPEIWLLYGPLILSNLVLFVAFYAASIYMALKNRLQAHKRFIIVASAIGLGAGLFRFIFFMSGFNPWSLPMGVLGCSVFIIIGILYDFVTQKYLHPAYWIGLIAMLIVEISLLPQVNAALVAWINEGLAALGEHLMVFY
ncbi:hypothetical protein [Paucihalobacter sp.]|uniref:hypothetical protein n=1 Tax=Paucihalobacter sp. TaxID=2850405 RepID=UPI002FE2F40E